MSSDYDRPRPFDRFELAVTLLLGLAALGVALCTLQSSVWNGKSIEAYADASTMATKASVEHDRTEVDIARDLDCDLKAKENILEARDSTTEADKSRHFHLASYLYAVEMSPKGYAAMGLPAEYHTAGNIERHEGIPPRILLSSLERRLGSAYEDQMLAAGREAFEAADKKMDSGRAASTNGDRFDLTTVSFTVSLFFGGLGLVFKTRIRWTFVSIGAIILLVGFVGLLRTPWG